MIFEHGKQTSASRVSWLTAWRSIKDWLSPSVLPKVAPRKVLSKLQLPLKHRSKNHNRLRASPATGSIMSAIQCSPGCGGRSPCTNPTQVCRNLQWPWTQRWPGTYTKTLLTKPANLFRISRPVPLKPRFTAKSKPRSPVYQQITSSSLQLASRPDQSCRLYKSGTKARNLFKQQLPWRRRITKPGTLHAISSPSIKSWINPRKPPCQRAYPKCSKPSVTWVFECISTRNSRIQTVLDHLFPQRSGFAQRGPSWGAICGPPRLHGFQQQTPA